MHTMIVTLSLVFAGFSTIAANASENFAASAKSIPQFARVTDEIFRGGRPTSQSDMATLKRKGVRTVLNLENRPADVARERRWAEELGMEYVNVSLSVHERPTDPEMNRVLATMRDSRLQPVFVHCMHGKDRTGLAIGLYRVEEEGWQPREAYREMIRNGFDPQWTDLVDYFNDRTRR